MKVGDIYEVTRTVSFIQGPLYRRLRKGQKLWVTEVGRFWPTLEKEDGDYSIWGEAANDLIEKLDIIESNPLPYPAEYYKIKHSIKNLKQQLKKEEEKLKKFK